ncbi:SIR2 family protein [Microbacterium sp. X-17]|uniref:SIR2 family protein n=1 Tax=Microbacterium sp. X-17 TaxID=3144404 RepID=UPI0031F51A78
MVEQRLRNAADSGSIVLVVGTGVSAALTGGAPTATWHGLLQAGLMALEPHTVPATLDYIRNAIDYGFGNDDLTAVLQAADRMRQAFEEVGNYAFTKWLQEHVGGLRVAQQPLLEALTSLPFPILTTNYDTLLEGHDRASADWTDSSQMQAVLAGNSNAIGHLHGIWRRPESVVLTSSDYTRLLESSSAQDLQRAASTLKTLVYVGFGSGLADPNFGRLIQWHRETFIPSSVQHFRLCLNRELAELEREHANDQIIPVGYGDDYAKLAGFLESLKPASGTISISPSGIARDVVSELQLDFENELTTDAILAEALDVVGACALADVVRPPVLLPVPHADFVRAQRRQTDGGEVARLDAFEVARSAEVVLVAADESSGLTTAVKWLALESATYLGGAAPLYVSFRRLGRGHNPLKRLVETEARSHGLLPDRGSQIPPHVLAIDDFSPYVEHISDRAIQDIAASDAIVKIIGCKVGAEDLILEKLQRLGVDGRVHYLGRLTAADIRAYAQLASPVEHEQLAERVLNVLQTDNLPRTPNTVALLIAVLLRGGALGASKSQTSILDDYVAMLLGRGDPHEDARLGLDKSSREALLAGLSKALVVRKTGGLTEEETVAAFRAILERLDWNESALDLVRSLIDRKILRKDGQHVVFARSSYLHLFAAKRAAQDQEFLAHLLQDPVFFSPILMDYAAIKRHDALLVSRLNELLARDEWATSANPVFELVPSEDAPKVTLSETKPSRHESGATAAGELEVFDAFSDTDEPPFPLTEEEELPRGVLLMRTLELVSSALRDSDQIEDINLKQHVLENVLLHWGRLMGTVSSDYGFRDFIANLVDEMDAPDTAASDEDREERIDVLVRVFPAAISLGGVLHTLASRKLSRALERLVPAVVELDDDELTVATAFMIFALRDEGWVQALNTLLARTGNIWVIRNFLLQQLRSVYVGDEGAERVGDEELLSLCVTIIQKAHSYGDAEHRNADYSRIRSQLMSRRLEELLSRRSQGGTIEIA